MTTYIKILVTAPDEEPITCFQEVRSGQVVRHVDGSGAEVKLPNVYEARVIDAEPKDAPPPPPEPAAEPQEQNDVLD